MSTLRRALIASGLATLALTACAGSDPPSTTSSAAPTTYPTTVTTEASTTTTVIPTTTTTLPAPPTFVVLCPGEATFGYFGKPTDFTLGYQNWIGTETYTLDISWGDGKGTRFTSLAAFDKRRTHSYEPGSYQVSALLTDAYGRTASSTCNIKWTDSLPKTMNAIDCAMRGNMITTYERGPSGGLESKSVPDPSCAR